jgi:hypothetical protein
MRARRTSPDTSVSENAQLRRGLDVMRHSGDAWDAGSGSRAVSYDRQWPVAFLNPYRGGLWAE